MGNGGSNETRNVDSELFQDFDEGQIRGLSGPKAIAVGSAPGTHVYVACDTTRTVIVFARDTQSGLLRYKAALSGVDESWGGWGSEMPAVGMLFLVADGNFLYGASPFPGAVHVFGVGQDGALTEKQRVDSVVS